MDFYLHVNHVNVLGKLYQEENERKGLFEAEIYWSIPLPRHEPGSLG